MTQRAAQCSLQSACLVVLTLHAALGCTKRGSPHQISSSQELKPDVLFEEKAILNYAGLPVHVQVRRVEASPNVRFELEAHGQVLETEVYRSTEKAFSLVSAIDQSFDPPLDLLRFPMTIGESWSWSGKLAAGPAGFNASAKVTSVKDKIVPGDLEATRVDVKLEIDSGSAQPAVRELNFWFVRERGIAQRKFGAGATERIPAGPEGEGSKSEAAAPSR